MLEHAITKWRGKKKGPLLQFPIVICAEPGGEQTFLKSISEGVFGDGVAC
jgi:hypothetical protein